MRLIWLSDIHLNFLNEQLRHDFYMKINESTSEKDAIVISGDIAESHNVIPFIKSMEEATELSVYFVLGNHDFYGSNVKNVRKLASRLEGYLQKTSMELNAETILLGVDGWGDCRFGDYENSRLVMSDWLYIDDLRKGYQKGSNKLKEAIQKLADSDAAQLAKSVSKAIKSGYKKIIIVTHVPPFEQCCLYEGKKSTPSGLPFFASKCLGDAILPIAEAHSDIDFLWLSGHTHSRATYKPCKNMTCKVAKSEYYFPQIEEILNV